MQGPDSAADFGNSTAWLASKPVPLTLFDLIYGRHDCICSPWATSVQTRLRAGAVTEMRPLATGVSSAFTEVLGQTGRHAIWAYSEQVASNF
jgi:hypothetical protein